jgi:hypothetical protein
MDEPNLQLRYEYKRGALNCADAIRARGKAWHIVILSN